VSYFPSLADLFIHEALIIVDSIYIYVLVAVTSADIFVIFTIELVHLNVTIELSLLFQLLTLFILQQRFGAEHPRKTDNYYE
jgi:hypothetical protein